MFGENYWNKYVVTAFAGVILVFFFLFGVWKSKKSSARGGIPDIKNPSLMPRTEQTISAEARLERWRNQKINLAVIGRSNTGKSTFINLIRDVKEGEPDYATTGSGNTTMDVHQYKHPKSKQLVLWDVPGVGTAIVTKEKFMKKVKLSMFDFCFIFLDSVFSEDDIWLAKTLKSLKIPFCFIRSKIDVGIEKSSDPKAIVAKTREKLLEEKRILPDIEDSKLFLISNSRKHFHLGDLTKLFNYITSILPVEKVEVLLFFLPILSPETIERKYYAFKNRIEKISLIAFAISFIPFIDMPGNLSLITDELRLYIQGFGLDKDYIKNVPGVKQRSDSKNVLESVVTSKCRILTVEGKIQNIPILGTVASAAYTKIVVPKYLLSTLDELKKDAELVYEFYTYGE